RLRPLPGRRRSPRRRDRRRTPRPTEASSWFHPPSICDARIAPPGRPRPCSFQSDQAGGVAADEAADRWIVEAEFDAEADDRPETAYRSGVVDLAKVGAEDRPLGTSGVDHGLELFARIILEPGFGDEHAQRMLDEGSALGELAYVA